MTTLRGQVEGAGEVLPRLQVDPGLAADRGVHLADEARRPRAPRDPAQVGRRDEPGDVARRPAAEGDDRAGPVERQLVPEALDDGERLRGLPGRQDVHLGEAAPRASGGGAGRSRRRGAPSAPGDRRARIRGPPRPAETRAAPRRRPRATNPPPGRTSLGARRRGARNAARIPCERSVAPARHAPRPSRRRPRPARSRHAPRAARASAPTATAPPPSAITAGSSRHEHLGDQLLLEPPELRLASLLEDPRDRPVPSLELLVDVDERPLEACGDLPPDRRLPGAHEPGEREVAAYRGPGLHGIRST